MQLIIVVGLPGSGKTTFWKNTTCHPPMAVRVSLDDFRRVIIGKDYFAPFEPTVHAWTEQTVRYLLSQGFSVYLDATSIRRGLRAKYIRLAKEYGAETVCYEMKTSYHTCLERNKQRERVVPEEVIRRMSEDYEEPTIDEGFDRIFAVSEEGHIAHKS